MFTEDLSVFFDSADGFAIDALWTLQGVGSFTIPVIFDNGYSGISFGEADQAARGPRCMVRDDQLLHDLLWGSELLTWGGEAIRGGPMNRGDTLTINSVAYKVGNIEPEDQPGISWIVLRK
jgi:hypothetical protein